LAARRLAAKWEKFRFSRIRYTSLMIELMLVYYDAQHLALTV